MKTEEKLLIKLIQEKTKKKDYKGINQKKFLELCVYHRITGFISKKINKKLAPKTAKELNLINKKILLKNFLYKKEIDCLAEEFQKKRINFIAIKGTALNYSIYSKTMLRVSADFDFLIKEKNYNKTKRILKKKKYFSDSADFWEKSKKTKKVFFNWFYENLQHYPLMKKKENGFTYIAEPHKSLFFPVNSFQINLNEIWRDSTKINNLRIPCKEDNVIISVLSSVYHDPFNKIFESLVDVNEINSKGLNEKKLKEKAVKYNAVEELVYFNELLKELFGKEIKGIKKLKKISDKRKLNYLRKKTIKKLIKKKNAFFYNYQNTKNRLHWTDGLKKKIKVVFFSFILPLFWKIRHSIVN